MSAAGKCCRRSQNRASEEYLAMAGGAGANGSARWRVAGREWLEDRLFGWWTGGQYLNHCYYRRPQPFIRSTGNTSWKGITDACHYLETHLKNRGNIALSVQSPGRRWATERLRARSRVPCHNGERLEHSPCANTPWQNEVLTNHEVDVASGGR